MNLSFRETWRTLKKSDFKYTISNTGEPGGGLASFDGAFDRTITGLSRSELTGEYEDLVISGGNPGGKISFDINEAREIAGNDIEQVLTPTHILEEFIHAEQYDYYVHKCGQNDKNLPGLADFETEAKAVNGIVKSKAGISLSKGTDNVMESYGKSAFQRGASLNEYQNAAKQWHVNPKTNIKYRQMQMKNTLPEYFIHKATR